MFKNAFLSEFCISPNDDADSVLKSHLLSNEKIIIPAATINKTEFGNIVFNNLECLSPRTIYIAHSEDCKNLNKYTNKYPEVEWEHKTLEVFDHFDKNNLITKYQTKDTINKFNALMRNCAKGKVRKFEKIFKNLPFV